MWQLEAINKITDKIKKDGLVEAIFLRGSIARNEADDFSDVDYYCIVTKENLDIFLDKRIEYLETYREILYYSFAYFTHPQIVCVFDDGLHFDLYTTTFQNLDFTDKIKILHDPKNLLVNYKEEGFYLRNIDVATYINEFTFGLLEFHAAYAREDYIWALRLVSHLSSDLGVFIRSRIDPYHGKLGLKGLVNALSTDMRIRYYEIIKLLKASSMLECVKQMVLLLDEYIMHLPIEIAEHVNYDFFIFEKKQIFSIER